MPQEMLIFVMLRMILWARKCSDLIAQLQVFGIFNTENCACDVWYYCYILAKYIPMTGIPKDLFDFFPTLKVPPENS